VFQRLKTLLKQHRTESQASLVDADGQGFESPGKQELIRM